MPGGAVGWVLLGALIAVICYEVPDGRWWRSRTYLYRKHWAKRPKRNRARLLTWRNWWRRRPWADCPPLTRKIDLTEYRGVKALANLQADLIAIASEAPPRHFVSRSHRRFSRKVRRLNHKRFGRKPVSRH